MSYDDSKDPKEVAQHFLTLIDDMIACSKDNSPQAYHEFINKRDELILLQKEWIETESYRTYCLQEMNKIINSMQTKGRSWRH